MGDSYNEKPVSNIRVADVIGMLGVAVIGLMAGYLLVMFVIHLFTGRAPT